MNWTGLIPIIGGAYLIILGYFIEPNKQEYKSANILVFKFFPIVIGILVYVYGLGVLGLISFKGV
jgi:hypothetical protein